MSFDKEYYLKFGHHNDNIGTVARHLDLIKTKKRVLVVPCGYGQIMNYLLSEGIDCLGYDVNAFLIQMAQKHLSGRIFFNDIRTMKKSKKPFDLIICTDVLEHLLEEEIDASLKNIVENLLPGGHVLMRIGTEELDVFDEDPTHKTKKSLRWWMGKFAQFGLYLYYGFTSPGEMVLSRRNPEEFIDKALENLISTKSFQCGHAMDVNGHLYIVDKNEKRYTVSESGIEGDGCRYLSSMPLNRIVYDHQSIFMLRDRELVGAMCASDKHPFRSTQENYMVRHSFVMPFYKKIREFKLVFPHNWKHLKKMNCEIVICMDDPEGEEELLSFIDQFDGKFKIVINRKEHPWRNPSKAINVGIRHSSGEKIIVTSPESAFDNLILHRLDSESGENCFAIGRLKISSVRNLFYEETIESISSKAKALGHYGSICVYKEYLEAIHGYDESLTYWGGDDDNIRARLRLIGCKPKRVDSYVVHFEDKLSPKRGGKSPEWKYYEKIMRPSSALANHEGWGNAFQEIIYDWTKGGRV